MWINDFCKRSRSYTNRRISCFCKSIIRFTDIFVEKIHKSSLTTLVNCTKQMQEIQHEDVEKREIWLHDIVMYNTYTALAYIQPAWGIPSALLPGTVVLAPTFTPARWPANQASPAERNDWLNTLLNNLSSAWILDLWKITTGGASPGYLKWKSMDVQWGVQRSSYPFKSSTWQEYDTWRNC